MPNYECAVVLAPTLTEEQIPQQIELMKGWIAAVGAQVSDVDVWGRRRLAFPINKQEDGFYVIYYFTFEGGQAPLSEFEKRMNTNESVLRHMVIRLPKLKERPRVPTEEEETEEGGAGRPPAAAPAVEVKEGEPAAAEGAPAPLPTPEQPVAAEGAPTPQPTPEQPVAAEGAPTPQPTLEQPAPAPETPPPALSE